MKTKKLPAVDVFQEKYTKLEKILIKLFRDYLYAPLLQDIDDDKKLKNAKLSELQKALRTGKIKYSNGQFIGKFNAKLSKELRDMGAKYDRSAKAYNINPKKIPQAIMASIASSQFAFEQTIKSINAKLAKVSPEQIAGQIKIEPILDDMMFDLNEKIDDAVKGITVTPKLDEHMVSELKQQYQQDMERYIKDFTEKEILEMRGQLQEMIFEGKRPANFTDYIQKRYQVGVKKAKFLARQETRLMLTKYKKEKYKSIGARKYVWQIVSGSPKNRVRTMHKNLDGTLQDWDNPPITDKNGNRNHPGEDYNCRCTARAVIEF